MRWAGIMIKKEMGGAVMGGVVMAREAGKMEGEAMGGEAMAGRNYRIKEVEELHT